ncbi:condensation domain-containing protein [Micromonospora sp. WMMD1102]|uniref:condensation domain-containing protein n=1 Tax=Micromonospora sp. WMMD1102 TaxID=3016105 RepID=UPI0024153437|nr:condensation domain-containing protein [Micromonospora sp. WMMD1102]MDG4787895.1 condensation domain-containing protein [Micromonospora sp. WMMD1102]
MTPTFPLSFAQLGLLRVDGLRTGSDGLPTGRGHVLGRCYDVDGDLRLAALRHALAAVVRRHGALRTVFRPAPDGPVQRVEPAGPVPLRIVDHSDRPAPLAGALAEAQRAVLAPFDLVGGTPVRFLVLRLAPRRHLFAVAVHPLVGDGRSIEIILRDLGLGYLRALADGPTRLPEPAIGYHDWVIWQRHQLCGIRRADLRAWWRSALADVPRILDLADPRPHPADMGDAADPVRTGPRGRGGRLGVPLPPATRYAVHALARRERATPSAVLLAGYAALLARYAGVPRLLVGIPVANREYSRTAEVVGRFVDTLPVPVDLTGTPTFAELVRRTRRATVGVLEHQDLPFEQLVADLAPARDGDRPPLVQVCFSHRAADAPAGTLTLPSCTVTEIPLDIGGGAFELTLSVDESTADGAVSAEYDADRFTASFVGELLRAYPVLLDAATGAPGTAVAELPPLPR